MPNHPVLVPPPFAVAVSHPHSQMWPFTPGGILTRWQTCWCLMLTTPQVTVISNSHCGWEKRGAEWRWRMDVSIVLAKLSLTSLFPRLSSALETSGRLISSCSLLVLVTLLFFIFLFAWTDVVQFVRCQMCRVKGIRNKRLSSNALVFIWCFLIMFSVYQFRKWLVHKFSHSGHSSNDTVFFLWVVMSLLPTTWYTKESKLKTDCQIETYQANQADIQNPWQLHHWIS